MVAVEVVGALKSAHQQSELLGFLDGRRNGPGLERGSGAAIRNRKVQDELTSSRGAGPPSVVFRCSGFTCCSGKSSGVETPQIHLPICAPVTAR